MSTSPVTRASIGLRSERGPVLLAVMLSTALVAIDATILATAVPALVSDLGGFSQFPWLFSIYLLAQAVSVPIYGKLSDLVGRKPVMLAGIGLFVVGSVLCGIAWSMPALIIFRAIQGLGAGAIFPMAMTIIGDLYTLRERPKVMGYTAAVWGMSSIVGPTLGGFFADYLSWRWIFFVNIPIGIAAATMLWRRFHEQVERKRHRIDYAGAGLLAVGGSLLVLGLLEGGIAWAWDSPTSIAVLAGAGVLLVAFGFVESRAAEPILPLWIFGHRILTGTNAASLVVGVLLIGLVSYVPLYAQGVLGSSALVAGFAVAAMTVGWPISAALSGHLYFKIGFRDTGFVGAALILVGTGLLLIVGVDSSVLHLAVASFFVGLGLGLIASPTLVAAQSSVGWATRGVVTGTNLFARSVGSAVGVAVFGAVANAAVARRGGDVSGDLDQLSPSVLEPALHAVFIGSAVAGVVMLAALAVVPRHTDFASKETQSA
ncbi:MDR family MFS transporter [Aeromicrobium sp.]|uniref:MDR family MFS transporter n=1 Tax=Aeromicrobium sp. TaxID=1871063 RepID=UPI003D6B619D